MPETVTIPNVPILTIGLWDAKTGEHEFTAGELADAVLAYQMGVVPAPVIHFGHDGPLTTDQPAIGRVDNLRLTNDGTTIEGDLTGLPRWLADILPTAYPNRSIEGVLDSEKDGMAFRLVITGLALLGASLPAVETLDDLRDLYSGEPPEWATTGGQPIAAAARNSPDGVKPTTVAADKEGEPMDTKALAVLLGLPEDTDEAALLAAIGDLKDAAAEPASPGEPTGLPDGVVTIDEDTLAQLRDDAAAGRQALQAQQDAERDQLVAAAVADGRIPPARREAWVDQLKADPGAREVLASLKPGLIPVQETGSGKNDTLDADDEAITLIRQAFGIGGGQ